MCYRSRSFIYADLSSCQLLSDPKEISQRGIYFETRRTELHFKKGKSDSVDSWLAKGRFNYLVKIIEDAHILTYYALP